MASGVSIGTGFSPSTNDAPPVDFNPNVPLGPAGPVSSFQSAGAQTMAQKQALLDAIANQGSQGKAAYAQQQAALNAVRGGAIQSQLQNAFGGNAAAMADFAAANQAGANSTALGQAALGTLGDANSRANANYYDSIQSQIPIAQARTQQQVNAIKSRQDLARQQYDAEQQRAAEQAQMQREEHAASMAKAQLELQSAGRNPQQLADAHQAALDTHALSQANLANKQDYKGYDALQGDHVYQTSPRARTALDAFLQYAQGAKNTGMAAAQVSNAIDTAVQQGWFAPHIANPHHAQFGGLDPGVLKVWAQRYFG